MANINFHDRNDPYECGIKPYVTGECPCHGDHLYFPPSQSPAHWKTAQNEQENEQHLRSLAAVGAPFDETKGLDDIESLYHKIMLNPKLKPYAEKLMCTLHVVKSGNCYFAYWYCNGCRGNSRVAFPKSGNPAQRAEAMEIFREVFRPYIDYYEGGCKGVDGKGTFSLQKPPEPSLPHMWPPNHRDCAWDTLKNNVPWTEEQLACFAEHKASQPPQPPQPPAPQPPQPPRPPAPQPIAAASAQSYTDPIGSDPQSYTESDPEWRGLRRAEMMAAARPTVLQSYPHQPQQWVPNPAPIAASAAQLRPLRPMPYAASSNRPPVAMPGYQQLPSAAAADIASWIPADRGGYVWQPAHLPPQQPLPPGYG